MVSHQRPQGHQWAEQCALGMLVYCTGGGHPTRLVGQLYRGQIRTYVGQAGQMRIQYKPRRVGLVHCLYAVAVSLWEQSHWSARSFNLHNIRQHQTASDSGFVAWAASAVSYPTGQVVRCPCKHKREPRSGITQLQTAASIHHPLQQIHK